MRSTVPPGVCPERSRRARWALPLLLLAILGLVIPGLVAPATAYTADDPGIKVEVTKLVATDKEGNGESDTQLIQWQPVKIGRRSRCSSRRQANADFLTRRARVRSLIVKCSVPSIR